MEHILADELLTCGIEAAEALGKIGDLRAEEALRFSLLRPDHKERLAAASALARLGYASEMESVILEIERTRPKYFIG